MSVVIRLGSTFMQLLLLDLVKEFFWEGDLTHGVHGYSRNDGQVNPLALALIQTEWWI